jgi:hypothetical protein
LGDGAPKSRFPVVASIWSLGLGDWPAHDAWLPFQSMFDERAKGKRGKGKHEAG